MTTAFEELAAGIDRHGSLSFARWSGPIYRELLEGPASLLWNSLQDQPDCIEVVKSYLVLCAEAIGHGYLARGRFGDDEDDSPALRRFMEVCWLQLIPARLARVRSDFQVRTLSLLWNLSEGLFEAPLWMDVLVTAEIELEPRLELAPRIARSVIEEALSEGSASTWSSHVQTSCIEMDAVQRGFQPGDMHIASPATLCVHHRYDASMHATVLLRPARKSLLLGYGDCIGTAMNGALPAPQLSFEPRAVVLEGRRISLPDLETAYKYVVSPCGYLIVNDVNLSRIWILECS